MRHDLLLTGGHVIDPASGVDGRKDVAFASGRVAAVDTAIPRETAREVVDVSGSYVAPGLVDLHAHAFIAGHDLGIETDPVCAATGVTTLCDAGSTGAANFPGLREYVMARADTRVLGFVHIAALGLSHLAIGEHCWARSPRARQVMRPCSRSRTGGFRTRMPTATSWRAPRAGRPGSRCAPAASRGVAGRPPDVTRIASGGARQPRATQRRSSPSAIR
jgi:hypothetical protein